MRLGGWTRIWVVLTVVLAVLVFGVAFLVRPTRAKLMDQWYSSASDLIATKIGAAEDRYVSAYDVQKAYFSASDEKSVALLERLANHPSERAKLFAEDLRQLNKRFNARLAAYPRAVAVHWALAALWWLVASVFLYLAGWSVGWVIRGFRERAA
jgi:hypothetical protein